MSGTTERTREEIHAGKRERILQEAVALFYAHGFTATTLDDIAAGLGVTKPFIYSHFRSKTELLAAPDADDRAVAGRRCERGGMSRNSDRAAAPRDDRVHQGRA